MQGIFNHTHDSTSDWRKELKKYQEEKKILSWGVTEKPRLITYKDIKQRDDEFNPILQSYRNKNEENLSKIISKRNMRETLAKNRDNALRIEQTYDIISLENKIKGLDSNKEINTSEISKIRRAKSNKLNNHTNYNIISNITIDKHTMIQPELRPNIVLVPTPKRIHKVNANYYRDYDIISNDYKEFHQDKTKIDKEVNKIETARKYNKLNKYNLIKAEFYDEVKEKEFQAKREESKNNWKYQSTKPKYHLTGNLYNPINMAVVNEPGLREADTKAKNKKKRYQLRNLIDQHFHTRDVEKSKQKEDHVMKRISYNRFKTFDDRGFDILNQDVKNEKEYKELNPNCKGIKNDWEQLITYAGDNNTYDMKKVYKHSFDCDQNEISKKTKQFMTNRKSKIIR